MVSVAQKKSPVALHRRRDSLSKTRPGIYQKMTERATLPTIRIVVPGEARPYRKRALTFDHGRVGELDDVCRVQVDELVESVTADA